MDVDALFFHAPGIQLLVAPDGTLRRANRAALDYFGISEEQVQGRAAGELLSCLHVLRTPNGCGAGESCQTCGLRTALLEAAQNAKVHRRIELRKNLLRHGRPTDVTLSVSVSLVASGGLTHLLVYLEDITAARLAEERLREQAALLAAAHDAISILDLEGRVRFWNRGAEQIYGWSPDEALGGEASNLVFGGSRVPWVQLRQLVLEEGHWDGELQQFHRNSQTLVVEVRTRLLRDARGDPRSILMVATDVTEKRQLERQVFRGQRLESLGTLACGIAHDLNNVLTPVQMVADLLRTSVSGSEGTRFLDLLVRSARRGSEIINQLLVFGRGAEGSRTHMDLRLLLKETAAILSETFPKSIRVRIDLPTQLWSVFGDATQIHQIVLNLCVNARDAMPHGGTLTLAAHHLELDEDLARTIPGGQPGKFVVIQVSDTGTGITPEVFDRIFDPFFTTKPHGHGTGLGLSTVQGIVRSHRGFVRVATHVGSGSQFQVYLPAGPDAAEELVAPQASPAPAGERQCILVAEDEETIRELLQTTLERGRYRVITAGDGAEAISVFGRRHPEISAVVIDMMMPFIDGATAIAMFRRLDPTIPILAISGLPNQREEAERAAGRRVAFLQKPFQMKELLGELNRCLEASTDTPATKPDPTGRENSTPPNFKTGF